MQIFSYQRVNYWTGISLHHSTIKYVRQQRSTFLIVLENSGQHISLKAFNIQQICRRRHQLRYRSMLEISNCYKILHLEQDCSDLELRQQYRKFALEWHPDKLRTKEFTNQDSDECFLRINQAYKSIVSYRKAKKKSRKPNLCQLDIQNQRSEPPFSLQQIRNKLSDLNFFLFPKQNSQYCGRKTMFHSEINKLYDEHISIIENLSQRLKEMRQN